MASLHHLHHTPVDPIGRREVLNSLSTQFDVALYDLYALTPE